MYFKLIDCEISTLKVMPFITHITSYTVVSSVIYFDAAFRTNTGHLVSLRCGGRVRWGKKEIGVKKYVEF